MKYIVKSIQVTVDDTVPVIIGQGRECIVTCDSGITDDAIIRPKFGNISFQALATGCTI
jgi:hypothetical protein